MRGLNTSSSRYQTSGFAPALNGIRVPKTISYVPSTAKQIIGSVVDEVIGQQNRPCATVEQIHEALECPEGS
jgi:hypothetical protein